MGSVAFHVLTLPSFIMVKKIVMAFQEVVNMSKTLKVEQLIGWKNLSLLIMHGRSMMESK